MAAELTQLPWERDVFTRLAGRWRDLARAAEEDAPAEGEAGNACAAPPIAPGEKIERDSTAKR